MRTRLAALTAAVSFSGLLLSAGLAPTAALAQEAAPAPVLTSPDGVPSALREATQVLLRAQAGASQAQGEALRAQAELAGARTAAERAQLAAADAVRRAGKASTDAARAQRAAKAARTKAQASARAAALAQRKARVRATRTLKLRAATARRASVSALVTARRADGTALTAVRAAGTLTLRARTAKTSAAARKAELAAAQEAARKAAEAAATAAAELARAEEAARLSGGTPDAAPVPAALPDAPVAGPAAEPAAAPAADPAAAPSAVLRPFSRGTAFWDAIPGSPRLDPANASIAAAMSAAGAKHILNVTQYGQPIYTATPTTPRYRLQITNLGTGPGQWGDNDLAHADVPIPLDAQPSPGTDGKLVVVDPVAGKVYDMWIAERTPTGGPGGTQGWRAAWGGVYDLDGDGSGHRATYGTGQYQVAWPQPVSRGTGSGISSLAGVLRVDELAAGRVDHALVFSTDIPCGPVDSSAYRFPATTTDGFVTGAPCIPQGTRLQLDPSIDLAAIPGITRAELVIGRALQTHGAYAMDKGGARMALVAETPENEAEAAVYTASGVSWDYFGLGKLPWTSLRVLASHDGR